MPEFQVSNEIARYLSRSRYGTAGAEFSSLNFSQVSKLVRSSPAASCLGSSLKGRKLSRLAPTDVGTPCAFLTGREKCGLEPCQPTRRRSTETGQQQSASASWSQTIEIVGGRFQDGPPENATS